MSDYEENTIIIGNMPVPLTALHSIRETRAISETSISRNRMIDAAVENALEDDTLFQECVPYLSPNGSDAGGKYQAHTVVALMVRNANPDGFRDVEALNLKELWSRIHKYLAGRGMIFVGGFVTGVQHKHLAATA
jgi:hypothetical protein